MESLRAVCAVLGMRVWQGSPHDLNRGRKGSSRSSSREEINRIEDLVSVVIADSSQRSGWEHLGLHVICVGEGLRLPGGEKLLGQLLAADMARWIATQGSVAGCICVGIAGWSGGQSFWSRSFVRFTRVASYSPCRGRNLVLDQCPRALLPSLTDPSASGQSRSPLSGSGCTRWRIRR